MKLDASRISAEHVDLEDGLVDALVERDRSENGELQCSEWGQDVSEESSVVSLMGYGVFCSFECSHSHGGHRAARSE